MLDENQMLFLRERHLATLTTLRADGTPHVVPVGFTYDADRGAARVITFESSQKVHNAERGGRASLCQVDGRRWLTLEGTITVVREAADVAAAVTAYADRYRQPGERSDRVVLELAVDRVMGRVGAASSAMD